MPLLSYLSFSFFFFLLFTPGEMTIIFYFEVLYFVLILNRINYKVKRETSGTEVNELLKSASEDGPLKGIMGYETRPLVSTDYTNDERSGIIDARSTMVVDGTCVKVCVSVRRWVWAGIGVCRLCTNFHTRARACLNVSCIQVQKINRHALAVPVVVEGAV